VSPLPLEKTAVLGSVNRILNVFKGVAHLVELMLAKLTEVVLKLQFTPAVEERSDTKN